MHETTFLKWFARKRCFIAEYLLIISINQKGMKDLNEVKNKILVPPSVPSVSLFELVFFSERSAYKQRK